MRIKLAAAVKETPAGSIVECDDAEGAELIGKSLATTYGAAEEQAERNSLINEAAQASVNQEKSMSIQKDQEEFVIGKAIHQLAVKEGRCKAVTGMSEGTPADGGALLGTMVTDVVGVAMTGSVIYPKVQKIKLPAGFNSAKVPIDDSDGVLRANAPVATSIDEGAQKTSTKLQFSPVTVNLRKTVMYVPLVDELLQDVPALDAFVRNWMRGKLAADFDCQAMNGTAATSGLVGVCDATASAFYTSKAFSASPTLAEVYAAVAAIHPALRGNLEWYIANGTWQTFLTNFATSANIQAMLIDPRVGQERLIGLKVNIQPGMTAAKGVVLGDFSQYVVVEPANNDIIASSTDVRFEYDETVLRIVRRMGGTPAFCKRTLADSTTVAAFVNKT